MHTNKKISKIFFEYPGSTILLQSAETNVKHGLYFISDGIFDQICIAMHCNIFALDFKGAFGKANSRVLVCLVLYG